MKIVQVSKESKKTLAEKISLVKGYAPHELMAVLRAYESSPGKFELEVIEPVIEQLRKKDVLLFYR